jgi:hypothetical protein
MNKPSERIVVFVTTAQKRAIAASAEKLGISVSELMRRAVLSFGATSEQVKAASIVDRLRAPRAPDALNAALQRVARGTRYTKAALPPALQTKVGTGDADTSLAQDHSPAEQSASPLLPAGVLAALAAAADEDAAAVAAAVARVTAAEATDAAGATEAAEAAEAAAHGIEGIRSAEPTEADSLVSPRPVTRRTRIDANPDEDDPHSDPTTGGGRFA